VIPVRWVFVALTAWTVMLIVSLGSLFVALDVARNEREALARFVCFSALVHAEEIPSTRIAIRFQDYLDSIGAPNCDITPGELP